MLQVLPSRWQRPLVPPGGVPRPVRSGVRACPAAAAAGWVRTRPCRRCELGQALLDADGQHCDVGCGVVVAGDPERHGVAVGEDRDAGAHRRSDGHVRDDLAEPSAQGVQRLARAGHVRRHRDDRALRHARQRPHGCRRRGEGRETGDRLQRRAGLGLVRVLEFAQAPGDDGEPFDGVRDVDGQHQQHQRDLVVGGAPCTTSRIRDAVATEWRTTSTAARIWACGAAVFR